MEEQRYVTWDVFHEMDRRYESENQRRDDENNRQNKRIDALEQSVKEISKLTVSVERLAMSTENMATELSKQGEKLDAIEQRPVKRWDTVIGAINTGIVGLLVGLLTAGVMP